MKISKLNLTTGFTPPPTFMKKLVGGFTLMEILMVIAISVVILGIVFTSFNDLIRTQALAKDHVSILAVLDQAKSLAINSKSASQYGVHFASTTVILFTGTAYEENHSANQVFTLNSRVYISDISLIGADTDQVVFSRITGYANAQGTVTLALKNNPASTKIIQIYQTGLIE